MLVDMNLDTRKEKLLNYLVREYIKSAEPVGSGVLVEKYDLDVSSATVRNNLVELEKEGLIFQPHTSAGRIPTEKGFQYFVDNCLQSVGNKHACSLQEASDIKNFAKNLAKITSETVILAFNYNDVYYTGISNLFKKPEFRNQEIIVSISDVIDRLDEVIPKIYNEISEEPKILLGANNPFGNECASILMKKDNLLFGVLGLMRMDYEKNLALIKHTKNIIQMSHKCYENDANLAE